MGALTTTCQFRRFSTLALRRGKAFPCFRLGPTVLGQVRADLPSRGFVHPTQKHVHRGKVLLTWFVWDWLPCTS
jgi:hypothetical protein